MAFTKEKLSGIEWQQIVAEHTPQRLYRVEITWALDRYRISVFDIASGHCIRRKHAWYLRTAVESGNALLRKYARREPVAETSHLAVTGDKR